MPDKRKHRGPHSSDAELFAAKHHATLREAVHDLSWLLTRSYALNAAMKLVGDRFQLAQRQRLAVVRCACSDVALERRSASRLPPDELANNTIDIDGFNLLTTIEAALGHGFILIGRDGVYRDMASMHGNYRKVAETRPALELIGEMLAKLAVERSRWLFDKPVSNSGRIAAVVREIAGEHEWNWTAELSYNPDADLIASSAVVVSADSEVIDNCDRWFDLAGYVVRKCIADVVVVDLWGK